MATHVDRRGLGDDFKQSEATDAVATRNSGTLLPVVVQPSFIVMACYAIRFEPR